MENVRVLYDYQAFAMQTHGGVSRCFWELYKHLPQQVQAQITVKESDNVYIKEMQEVQPANDRYNKFLCKRNFKGKGHLHLWYDKLTHGGYYPNYNKNYSIELLKRGEFDVFHPTFFSDYFLPYLNGKPFVLTIHDMIPELYPQYYAKDDKQIVMKRKLASLANAIIAVSENTKKDIIRILDVPEEKIYVIYHGCSFPHQSQVNLSFPDSYVLYVGDRLNYKNFDLLVKHIAPFLKSHPKLFVVCTGKPFGKDELALMEKYGVKDRFVYIWASTDEELFSLYHHALCFVFPSEYEGFGIPILEAFQADCPVLLNNTSCFPEIAGDAAMYFEIEPMSSTLVDKLECIYSMSMEERESLLDNQRKRLQLYSWEKSALQLAELYAGIVDIK